MGGVEEGQIQHPAADQEAVQPIEDRRLGEAGIFALPGLREEAQELLAHPDAVLLLSPVREGGTRQHPLAEHGEGGPMDGVVVMGDPGQQDPQYLVRPGALAVRQLRQDPAQGQEAGRSGPNGGGADQVPKIVQTLRKLLVRELGDQHTHVVRDEGRNLVLTGLQLPQQVHDDLVLLIEGQPVHQPQQGGPGPFPHRQMLADRQEIGKVHGRVEGVLRVEERFLRQRVHLGQLHDPVDGRLQIPQIELRNGQLRQRLAL